MDPAAGMMGPPPMDPSMGMPPPPPPPEPVPPDITIESEYENLVLALRGIVDAGQEDLAKELIAMTPARKLEELLKAVDDEDYAFLLTLFPAIPGPIYDPDFVKPDKPDVGQVISLAGSDKEGWQSTLDRIREDTNLYHVEWLGHAKDFDADKDEEWFSSSMSDEVRAIAAMISSAKTNYKMTMETVENREETQRIEDTCTYWDQCEQLHYHEGCGGDLQYDEILYMLISGYTMSRVGMNFSGHNYPFKDALMDPQTTIPVWDGKSLLRVTCQYTDTIAKVISDYDTPDHRVRNKLMKMTNKMEKGKARNYRMNDEAEVICYHDRWWYCLIVDGQAVIEPTKHAIGAVPYVVTGSGMGEPMGMADNAVKTTTDGRLYGSSIGTRRNRMEYKNVSWFHFRKRGHAQKEIALSKLYTLLQHVDEPAWNLYQDDLADGTPIISTDRGKVNQLSQHERLEPMFTQVDQRVWSPLFNAISQDELTNRIPPEFFGIFNSASESGNALEGAYESGKDKLITFIRAQQRHRAGKASLKLMLYRDWGEVLANKDGEYAMLSIPHSRERQRAYNLPAKFTLLPKTIERVGTKVAADIVHLRMQNLGPLGNAGQQWLGMDAITVRELLEMRGVADPDAVMSERRYEKAQADEVLERALFLKDLRRRDPEAYQLYRELQQYEHAKAAGPQGGPPQGGPSPYPPMGPGLMGGVDLSAQGMGAEGVTGRPPGMQAPGPDLSLMAPTPGGIGGPY
jgi:hypothetical protein